MTDMNKLLGQLLGSGAAGGFAGGLAGGLTSSLLTSKSGRKIGTKALKMGGIAAVGALAYAAYQRYSTGKGIAPDALPKNSEAELSPVPEGSGFLPPKSDPPAGPAPAGCLLKNTEKRPFCERDLSNELCLNINGDHTVDLRHSAL